MCLADDDCPEEERKLVAETLASTPRPENFEPGKPDLPSDFWPDSGVRPHLAEFVGPNSWLIPHILGLGPEQMEWLLLEVSQWPLLRSFRKFDSFVKRLTIVNDPAERDFKLA